MKSTNAYRSARYRWRANQIAAKARRRLERGRAQLPDETSGKAYRPRAARHLWTIVVKHRDGSTATIHSDELPNGLTISPSAMGKKIENVMRFYK